MQRDDGLSSFLTSVLVPVCVWGLLAMLLLHLIDVREAFITGGEARLRQAALAFAAGVVLLQRLGIEQGRSAARTYAVALGVAMGLFALWHTWAHPMALSAWIILPVNVVLFAVLGWAGYVMTRACTVDEPSSVAAAEMGAFSPRPEPPESADEATWSERLPRRHPARLILYFVMATLPVFALGGWLLDLREREARYLLGARMFIFLWCAFALLFLSGLAQMRAYFKQRKVSLPEGIGLPWLSIGLVTTTAVLILAFLLPQPRQDSTTLLVRERIIAGYRGWESERAGFGNAQGVETSPDAPEGRTGGNQPGGRAGGRAGGRFDREAARAHFAERDAPYEELGDDYLTEIQRETGAEARYRRAVELEGAAHEAFAKAFDLFIRLLMILVVLVMVVAGYVVIMVGLRRLGEGVREWRRGGLLRRSKRWARLRRTAGEKPDHAGQAFAEFVHRAHATGLPGEGEALCRFVWEALLAYCADYNHPRPPDLTEREFVTREREFLEPLAPHAMRLARFHAQMEYSREPLKNMDIEALKGIWKELEQFSHEDDSRA